jgi:hypothetical protein
MPQTVFRAPLCLQPPLPSPSTSHRVIPDQLPSPSSRHEHSRFTARAACTTSKLAAMHHKSCYPTQPTTHLLLWVACWPPGAAQAGTCLQPWLATAMTGEHPEQGSSDAWMRSQQPYSFASQATALPPHPTCILSSAPHSMHAHWGWMHPHPSAPAALLGTTSQFTERSLGAAPLLSAHTPGTPLPGCVHTGWA